MIIIIVVDVLHGTDVSDEDDTNDKRGTSAATLQASSAPATATSSTSHSCQQRITPVRGLPSSKFLLFIMKISLIPPKLNILSEEKIFTDTSISISGEKYLPSLSRLRLT